MSASCSKRNYRAGRGQLMNCGGLFLYFPHTPFNSSLEFGLDGQDSCSCLESWRWSCGVICDWWRRAVGVIPRIGAAPGDTGTQPWVWPVPGRSGFPLVAGLGSTDSAGDRSLLFAGFRATTPASDFCAACIVSYGTPFLPDAAPDFASIPGRCADLPFPDVGRACVQWFFDTAEPGGDSPIASPSVLPSITNTVSALRIFSHFVAQSPCPHTPLSTLHNRPRGRLRMTRGVS